MLLISLDQFAPEIKPLVGRVMAGFSVGGKPRGRRLAPAHDAEVIVACIRGDPWLGTVHGDKRKPRRLDHGAESVGRRALIVLLEQDDAAGL